MSAETEQPMNDSQTGLLTDDQQPGGGGGDVKKPDDTQQIELLDVTTEEEMNKKNASEGGADTDQIPADKEGAGEEKKEGGEEQEAGAEKHKDKKGFRIWFKSPKRKSHKDEKHEEEGKEKEAGGGEKEGGEEKKEEFEEVKLVETDLKEVGDEPEAEKKKEKKEKKERKSWFQKQKEKSRGGGADDGKAVSAELNGSHGTGGGSGGEGEGHGITYQINLLDRDDRRINDVVKIDFEDVMGEPDGSHSVDCTWKVAHRVFTTTKLWIYRLLALLFSIPSALLCGAGFALVTLLHVWLLQPLIKMVGVLGHWVHEFVSIFLNAFCTPVFISISHLCSNVRINHTGTLHRVHEA